MSSPALALIDRSPDTATFRDDVLRGLLATPKSLPCQYFYDAEGSRLFEEICELEEYYLTRSEVEILQRHGAAIGAALGPCCQVVEYGSGSAIKTQLLFEHLQDPVAYVPVDIARAMLEESAARMAARWRQLEVIPIAGDYTRPFPVPVSRRMAERTVVFFPGSTIGNFHERDAQTLLAGMARLAGRGGAVVIGVDLEKDRAVLEPAYDDAKGVTAAFNLNLLVRINRELQGDFRLAQFHHSARWNPLRKRMEMHLVSACRQRVRVGDVAIDFAEGETIHTESSYKYSVERFQKIAAAAGLQARQTWTDRRGWFSVQYFIVE